MEKHGLIRSYYKYGENNLFISVAHKNPTIQDKYNSYDLNKYQKVYQYINSPTTFCKDSLYKSYAAFKRLFFDDFNYMPETYYYPEQKFLIDNKFKDYNLSLNNLWLIKPSNSYGGKGISFLNSLVNIKLKSFIITEYIKNVNLIKGKKYDLRLYVLLTGLKPLRIYFYKEGLVRIATEKYFLDKRSLKNKFVHLTNGCINQLNKLYIRPNSSNVENSNMWNILMYKSFLKTYNIEWENIREKIKDIIIKSIISVYQNLTEENESSKVSDQSFYEILGYDILINSEFTPKLMEINWVPNMMCSNDVDKEIKSNLFVDTLNLVGITPYTRTKKEPINNKFNIMTKLFESEIDDNINNAFCELERPRGDYELIFPTKETIKRYEKYFISNIKENKIFWNKILSFSY